MGPGYILSHDLVSFVSLQSPHLMWHVNEDTAVGAWVSALNHEQRSDEKFCSWWKLHHDSKAVITHRCKFPLLVILFVNHNREDIKKHFQYFHKHSNDSIAVLKQYIISSIDTDIENDSKNHTKIHH